jgi:molecular chaperone DnaJ
MTYIQTVPCYHCNGTGKIVLNKCSKCNGSGFTKEDRVFNLNLNDLNPTMPSGDYILSHGMGHESSDPQGPDGNLIGHVNINLGNYKVQNGNVFEQVEIPYYDILLGTDKEIMLPNGKEITVKIPSNSNNEDVIRSKGNGLNGKDYYLCIKATFPKTRKDDDKQLKKIKKNHS